MTPIPRDPVGDSGLVETTKKVLRILREQRLISDPSIQIDRTANGTRIAVAKRKGGGGGGADDLVWV